jgi:hypothetical protein
LFCAHPAISGSHVFPDVSFRCIHHPSFLKFNYQLGTRLPVGVSGALLPRAFASLTGSYDLFRARISAAHLCLYVAGSHCYIISEEMLSVDSGVD